MADEEKKRSPYDMRAIFEALTLGLIANLRRNLKRHREEEQEEGFRWEMWQKAKLRALAGYRKINRRLIRSALREAEQLTEEVIRQEFDEGAERARAQAERARQRAVEADIEFPEDIRDTLPPPAPEPARKPPQPYRELPHAGQEEQFFALNERKLNALEQAAKEDVRKAGGSVLRKMDDVYRQTIFAAEAHMAAGTKTLDQAIDMATRDFLDRGIDSITYADGRKINIASYAELALRTASQRATFMGEGARREELGVRTVVISAHNNCSDLCLPWQGKVYIDDVYSSGTKADGDYPLLSTAMRGGLFHPNCRHTMATFFPGISSLPAPVDAKQAKANYQAEQRQRYMERQIRRYKRREAGAVDPDNQAAASAKVKQWQEAMKAHMAANKQLRRDTRRERNLLPQTASTTVPSGATKDPKRREKHAETYYEHVRKRKDDVRKIANNSGFKPRAIQEIKEHVFLKEHMLQGKMQRFWPDYEQAQTWQRLIEGNHTETDMVFLRHEYVELTQMRIHGYTYDKAHAIANKRHNWQKLIEEG